MIPILQMLCGGQFAPGLPVMEPTKLLADIGFGAFPICQTLDIPGADQYQLGLDEDQLVAWDGTTFPLLTPAGPDAASLVVAAAVAYDPDDFPGTVYFVPTPTGSHRQLTFWIRGIASGMPGPWEALTIGVRADNADIYDANGVPLSQGNVSCS